MSPVYCREREPQNRLAAHVNLDVGTLGKKYKKQNVVRKKGKKGKYTPLLSHEPPISCFFSLNTLLHNPF